MIEKSSLRERSIKTLREGGLAGLSRRAALYLTRRIAWRADESSRRLDFAISGNNLMREFGAEIKRNEIFRDRHKGERCFVIGNGPSLRHQDLSPLGNEITLVTNSFYLHPLVGESWQPDYYFVSDPYYFNGSESPEFFSDLTSRIPKAPFFVPHFARDFLTRTKLLPSERTHYVAVLGGLEDESWQEKPDLTRVTPGMQTVVQLAIMTAIYMGCSEIYLLGLDHDWLSRTGEQLNFYSDPNATGQPTQDAGSWTYRTLMEALVVMWQLYERLGKLADREGIKIINATRGGFLDVFERACYEEIIPSAAAAANNSRPESIS